MEELMCSLKNRLSEDAYRILDRIVGFVSANYIMDELFDGKDELKFKRSGKTLLTIYLKEESIVSLIIFGKAEREMFDAVRDGFSEFIQNHYDKSRTYHDGKWKFIELDDERYLDDAIRLICLKKKPNRKTITMCGYRCDLCMAHAANIRKEDRREEISRAWDKYYGLRICPSNIFCDGCRSIKIDAKLIDAGCPVRKCVISKSLDSCADCSMYPCEIFTRREGLCYKDAKEKLGDDFSSDEYEKYLLAYDNRTRIDRLRKNRHIKDCRR